MIALAVVLAAILLVVPIVLFLRVGGDDEGAAPTSAAAPPTSVAAAATTAPPAPTTSVRATTTTVRDPSDAFCAAFQQAKRVVTMPAAQYVAVFEVMAIETRGRLYEPEFRDARDYLARRLAEIGPDHTGQELWGAPGAFNSGSMARISTYALRCDGPR